VRIRRAVAADAPALAALSFRSKAHWGYDGEFMELVRPALTPSEDYIAESPVYVAAEGRTIVGFYGFCEIDGRVFLHDLFVEPAHIGSGIGSALWLHAIATARERGHAEFFIESDPFAEPFYLRLGAQRVGEITSPSTGRALPLLRYAGEDRGTTD
jgi:GNAT superfamily N-acetyltransferase